MRVLVAALAALIMVTGCSNDKPAASPPPTPTPTQTPSDTPTGPSPDAELRGQVQAYSDAYLTGDTATAYALLSARCKDRIPRTEMQTLVTSAKAQYGEALPFTSYQAQIAGDLARVTYTYTVHSIDQDHEPWVREAGSWHEDDC